MSPPDPDPIGPLARRDGERWFLELDRAQGNLFNDRHRGVIAEALSRRFGAAQRVEITPAEVAGETPARRRQRLQQEAVAEATRSLQADPRLQCLMEEFDAEFIADSVRVKES